MELGIGSRVRSEELGVGIVIQVTTDHFIITFVNHGVREVARLYADEELEVIESVEPSSEIVSLETVEQSIKRVLGGLLDEQTETDLGDKWVGGTLIFQPADEDLKSYEMPIETFFHKIVMVRDRLRVMEQRINSSKLTDEEKVNLQQYITKIYGSLTSFNILFDEKENGFRGSGRK
ncbi:MAG: hypothetical protein WBA74_16035 [Cyclobacteriaceae bacterium]